MGGGPGSLPTKHRASSISSGGIQRALTANLTARVEYLYDDFDSATAPPGALGGTATSLDPTLRTVRCGLNHKF